MTNESPLNLRNEASNQLRALYLGELRDSPQRQHFLAISPSLPGRSSLKSILCRFNRLFGPVQAGLWQRDRIDLYTLSQADCLDLSGRGRRRARGCFDS